MVKIVPRKFSGEEDTQGKTEDPGKWLEHFEMTCRPNDWFDDDDKKMNFPAFLIGEAEDWYIITRHWIDAEGRTWAQVKTAFVTRFRPADYDEEVENMLRTPVQMVGESVRAYAGRFTRLQMQGGGNVLPLDGYRKYWIAGLREEIKVDVMMMVPNTFVAAAERAQLREQVLSRVNHDKVKTDEGKRPQPEAKNPSMDARSAEGIVSDIAGLGRSRREAVDKGKEVAPEDDPGFKVFYKEMSPEIEKHEPSIDELVEKYKAWKLYSMMYQDPAMVKVKILKSMVKKEERDTTTVARERASGLVTYSREGPTCFFCKETGHISRTCPKKPAYKCYVCGEEGHGARACPKNMAMGEPSGSGSGPKDKGKDKEVTVSAKKSKAVKADKKAKKVKKATKKHVSDDDDSDDEVITAYMARLKRKQNTTMEEDGPSQPEKAKKTTKKTRAKKTLDPEVVQLFRQMQVPLGLVAKHGASFESMAKRAVREVYLEGRDHRKRVNPAKASGKLSHALMVSGTFAGIKCSKLIIDPGSSVSTVDVSLARKAGLGIKTKSKIIWELADGSKARPLGQTATKENVNIEGVEVSLRLLVADSNNTYDILLGRDWLYKVNAKGNYLKNTYTIEAGGKAAKLRGQVYKEEEVSLSDSSEESESTSDEESSSDDSDEESSSEESEEEEEVNVPAFLARGYFLDEFDAKPRVMESIEKKASMRVLTVEHLKEVDINPELEEGQRKKVEDLLWEYRDCFASSLAELGQTSIVEHEINLKPDAKPFYCPGTRRFAPLELEAIRKNIEEEMVTGKIIEYDGPWCAPIVLVKKKDGGFRKCVAYNGLNDRTERESWPLPNIEELLERMAGHSWYSACDGFAGYYSVKIRDADVAKTMFKTPFGTFAYKVMPFGLKNAPHTYSRVTAKAFGEMIGKTLEAYIDDTATYSDSFDEHLVHLKGTFEAAMKGGIKLKASKCHFCYPEIEFVGHLVGTRGIRMMPEKVERVQAWPVPKNQTELKGFLGLAGYYRRLVKEFASIAVPLNKMTSRKTPYEWGKEQQEAFVKLKLAITTAPVLGKPNYEKDWVLDVDASDVALGAVLGQEQEDMEVHPVYFWSRQLSKSEKNYSVTDRECLAVVAACKKLRPYILGRKVVIFGDHTAVKWIFNKTDISGIHARWKVTMSEFDYEVKSKPGSQNGNADAMSRMTHGKEETKEIDDAPEHLAYKAMALRTKWMEEEWYCDVYQFLETLATPKASAAEREKVRRRALRFAIHGKGLYFRDSDGGLKVCLGKDSIKEVLCEYHEGAVGGHFGRDITVARVRQHFWWPTLWRDVAEHIKTCDICQRYGPKEHHNALRPYQPVYPFEFIFLDFVINLPSTATKRRHLITMTEGLTKWIEAKPVKEADAKTAASFLMDDIIHRFGAPQVVITDNGSHFRGEFHELCEKLKIEHRYATAYHPQTTGQDERTNGLLLGRIRKWRLEKYNKWDEDMPASVLACNTRKISTTGFSAMESLMGYTASTASSLRLMKMSKKELNQRIKMVIGDIPDKITGMRLRVLESLRDEAIRVKKITSAKMKERYDKRVRERPFAVGDEVLVYDSTLLKQWSRKLEERWLGPYRIVWKGSLGAYAIEVKGKQKMVSGDQLKEYHRRV